MEDTSKFSAPLDSNSLSAAGRVAGFDTDESTVYYLPALPVANDEPEDWRHRALCAETDPESFFPEKGGSTKNGKRICTGCPVRQECLDYALAHDERYGIWGGLSERERRRLKKGLLVLPSTQPPNIGDQYVDEFDDVLDDDVISVSDEAEFIDDIDEPDDDFNSLDPGDDVPDDEDGDSALDIRRAG